MRRSRPRVGRPLSGRRGGERPRRSPAPRESAAASHVTRAAQPTWANPPIDVGEGPTQVMDGASAPPSETAPRQPRSRRRRRPEEGEHGVRHRQCRARARPPPRGEPQDSSHELSIPKTSILAVLGLNTQFEVEALMEYQGFEAMRMEMLGNWLLVREPEQKAKDPGETLKLKDIENFPINQIVKYKDISELKLKIDGVGADEIIVENDRQQILSSSSNSIEILLKKNYQISNYQEDNIQLYLESTENLPLNLPELKKINPIKDNDLSNLKKSEILNRFVHNFIEYTVRPEGPELRAIITEKKGDCSEYATLMTALARLNGIPAREVSGYAYTDGNNSPSFGAHAWVELYIDGKWREFDPTWDETKLGVEHILFKDATMLVGGSIKVLD